MMYIVLTETGPDYLLFNSMPWNSIFFRLNISVLGSGPDLTVVVRFDFPNYTYPH
jgi:hypothetical protein